MKCSGRGTGARPGRQSRRSSSQGWTTCLAPRFERKAFAEQKQFYHEGEICEAEDLPNGFTKIRSKNLDVLFKQDYYEQRKKNTISQEVSEKVNEDKCNLAQSSEEDQESDDSAIEEENEQDGDKLIPKKTQTGLFDKIDPTKIAEFKPSNLHVHDSDPSSPIYINHIPHDLTQYAPPPHPHLYLYSPSDNTLIPCEEIIIPSHGMCPEYPGPINIYLTYHVQGPDGRGYITSPFTPPSSYMSQDSAYSTTPQDSEPTTPPTLVNYSPDTWVDTDMSHRDTSNTVTPKTNTIPTGARNTDTSPEDTPNTDASSTDTTKTENNPTDTLETDASPADTLNTDTSPTDTPNTDTSPADTPDTDTSPTDTPNTDTTHTDTPNLDKTNTDTKLKTSSNDLVGNIHGLVSNKQKKTLRKKKMQPLVFEQCKLTSSESETQKRECHVNEITTEIKKFDGPAVAETSVEIALTDDLADSLVNPPTDHQVCDKNGVEYSKNVSHPDGIVQDNSSTTDKLPVIFSNDVENEVKESPIVPQGNITDLAKSDDSVCKSNESLLNNSENCFEKTETAKYDLNLSSNKMKEKIDTEDGVIVASLANSETESKTDTSLQEGKNEELNHFSRENGAVTVEDQRDEHHEISESQACCPDRLEVKSKTSMQKSIIKQETKKKKMRKGNRMLVPDNDDNSCSQDGKSNEKKRKSYSSVIKQNIYKQSNNNSTMSSNPLPVLNSLPAKSSVIRKEADKDFLLGNEAPLPLPNQDIWKQTSRRRKNKIKRVLINPPSLEEIPDRKVTFCIEEKSLACDAHIEPENKNVENHEKKNVDEMIQEKNKTKKKRSKLKSREAEENPHVKRIIISDDQVKHMLN